MPPVEGRPLIMYLTVPENSMGCVLGQHDESGQKDHAIYYLSKKFTDCETRYSLLEKTHCALACVVPQNLPSHILQSFGKHCSSLLKGYTVNHSPKASQN